MVPAKLEAEWMWISQLEKKSYKKKETKEGLMHSQTPNLDAASHNPKPIREKVLSDKYFNVYYTNYCSVPLFGFIFSKHEPD